MGFRRAKLRRSEPHKVGSGDECVKRVHRHFRGAKRITGEPECRMTKPEVSGIGGSGGWKNEYDSNRPFEAGF